MQCILGEAWHARGHDRQTEHRGEQPDRPGPFAGGVAVEHERRPADPEGQEEHGIQQHSTPRDVFVDDVCQGADAGHDHEVEEQLCPVGVPFFLDRCAAISAGFPGGVAHADHGMPPAPVALRADGLA